MYSTDHDGEEVVSTLLDQKPDRQATPLGALAMSGIVDCTSLYHARARHVMD